MKPSLLLIFLLLLSGCVTIPQGNYRLRAMDASGVDLTANLVLTAAGRGIYTTRNALCASYPGATVLIEDTQTGRQLEGESPYRCR
ncbi:MAG: hypothetical protein LBE33_03830 [Zoogloeaceae bacterium]|jgi:hypothetical protein|nr:hypothetical protein [Zoogloeaceae bacterium]